GQGGAPRICIQSSQCFNLIPSSASSPAVTSWGPGRMDVFVTADATDYQSHLLHSWADNYTWSGIWEDLGMFGVGGGAPGAVSWGPGRIDVFASGQYHELRNRWFDSLYGWTYGFPDYFGNLGGNLTSLQVVVASPGPGRLNVFTRGAGGRL